MEEEIGLPKKHHLWIIMSAVFLIVLGFLIYTSFYNPGVGNLKPITGNVVKEDGSIIIDASLDSPEELNIKSEIEKIDLRLEKGSFTVGNQIFDLEDASIIIDNFDGQIHFSQKKIIKLDGKAEKVFVEGLPITGKSDLKISLQDSEYNLLKLNNFYLSSLSYLASGVVKLNKEKVVINLDEEDFKIEKFTGSLETRKNNLKLKGNIAESNLGFIDVRSIKEKEIEEVEEAS